MIVAGVVYLLLGWLLGLPILWGLGVVLVAARLVLTLLGTASGRTRGQVESW
jgi:hypothetical protein